MISTIELTSKVIDQGLCTNCGACQGMCPYWYSVKGRTSHCFECNREDGRCLNFCPMMPTDHASLLKMFFPEENILPELGPFRGLYLTRATDKDIAKESQHGGTVTALLKLALKEGFIDAAVLSRSEGGLEPQGVLAVTQDDIMSCRGSSFQIPPTLAVLNQALIENKYHHIAVVGTPCKALAVRKIMSKSFPEQSNNADNISIIFGLFCGWGLDWKGLSDTVGQHVDAGQVEHMDILPSQYKCMELCGEFGSKQIRLEQIYPLVRYNCRHCKDLTAQYADISIGGARSADGWDEDKHWNQVIVRSEKGQKLLDLAREQGVLEFKDVPEGNLDKLKKAAQSKRDKAVG